MGGVGLYYMNLKGGERVQPITVEAFCVCMYVCLAIKTFELDRFLI